MFVSGWKRKTRKIIIPSTVPFYELLVFVKENTDRKRKRKQERKKEKNTDRTQTKLNAPHVIYNVKILPHYQINNK